MFYFFLVDTFRIPAYHSPLPGWGEEEAGNEGFSTFLLWHDALLSAAGSSCNRFKISMPSSSYSKEGVSKSPFLSSSVPERTGSSSTIRTSSGES